MPHTLMPDPETSDRRLSEALSAIREANFNPRMPSPWHIKIGKHNYFWTTGKITIDGGPKVEIKGLLALIKLLQDEAEKGINPQYLRSFNPPPISAKRSVIGIGTAKQNVPATGGLGSSRNGSVPIWTRLYRGSGDTDAPF